MADTRTEGLNFQQLVQQAVERSTNVRAQENYDNATRRFREQPADAG